MAYADKKHFFDQMITVYGRKPVLEVLRDPAIPVYRLHLAQSNRRDNNIDEMSTLASQRGIEVHEHSREQLSRISKNKRQDQGVAVDIQCSSHRDYQDFLAAQNELVEGEESIIEAPAMQLIALDRITNPQNLGMIIRSVCASPMDGLLLPRDGCASLSALVIKASAGTLFRCPLLRCDNLNQALTDFSQQGADIVTLSADSKTSLLDYQPSGSVVYVLGNETDGVSPEIRALANTHVSIPMNNDVESLNVAVTASLIAFRGLLST